MLGEVIVLAGGLGTRLQTAVPNLPKCLAPVAGKPFLQWLIDYYIKSKAQRFIFSLGYKHDLIEQFLATNYRNLNYAVIVEEQPLGTGGAIINALDSLQSELPFVVNGDTFFKVDFEEMSDFHLEKKAECTLALKPMRNSNRYGVVELDDDSRITAFKEKQFYPESLINGGTYLLNPELIKRRTYPPKFSFEKEYLETQYPAGELFGFVQNKYFIDIGIPEDFERAGIELPLQND